MRNFLGILDLLEIGEFKFDKELSGGQASTTLLYKKGDESFILKLLIAPRNDHELKRFEFESMALQEIRRIYSGFHMESTVPKLIISFTKHKSLPIYYFLMEKVDGLRLDLLFDEKPLPWNWKYSIDLFFRIASSLKYVELRFVHRDLHPKNIIIQEKFEYSYKDDSFINPGVTILDFGCSKDHFNYYFGLWDDDSFRIPGAVSSWSPELFANPNEVDTKHDSWALGGLLFRFLTNEFLFPAKSFGDITNFERNVDNAYRKIDKVDCPKAVKLLVKNCLCIDKHKRLSITQIVDACHDILFTELLEISEQRLFKYFSNGANLFRCDHCFEEDISSVNARCLICGHPLDDENMTSMLNIK